MSPFRIARLLGAGVLTSWALLIAPIGIPSASASGCPDVEVVFARGTNEPPGVGGVGQAFVDSLRSQVGRRSVDVYAVNYPASIDFPTGVDGVTDARAHVQTTAANCPHTRMVLGGFSQGAAVIGFVTAAAVPAGANVANPPSPMPPDVAKHVAAIALFGKPSDQFMTAISEPPITIGPLYTAKTTDLCAPGDPICSGAGDFSAHDQYAADGLVDQAAAFAAGRL